ncbi:TPA: PDC sensor domain-containing protein, partial [Campylobacter lari]|nr:PDC sensor domain-containing protein [Campylobacter lari]
MFSFKSLSSKLTFITCLLIIAILTVVNVINYYESKKTINDYLYEIQIKTMLDVAKVYELYGSSKRAAINSLEHSISSKPNMHQDEIIDILDTLKQSSDFELVYIGFEDTGKTYRSNKVISDITSGYDTKNRPWYKEAKAAGKLIVTDPYVSASSGQVTVTYAAPIYSDGKFIGVAAGDYDLSRFSNDVLSLGHSNSSYVAVYDREGVITFHEDKERMLTKNDLSINIANAVKANPDLVDPSKEETLFYAKDNAGKTQVATCTQSLNPKYIICSITEESVYTDAVNRLLFQQIIIAIIAITIALLLVRFAIIRNLKPIAIITSGLNSFFDFINHKTKDSAMIDVKTNDELGAMAKAINENITKTKNALEQDAKAVEQSVETAREIESGNLTARISAIPANPQLIELKNVLNEMLNVLEQKVGSNMNEINRVFDSYKALDFTTEVANAKGGVE